MPKITIKDVPPFDGDYDFLTDDAGFTGHELHLIKRIAGARLGEIQEAFAAKDYDLYVAFAAIALWRNGRLTSKEMALGAADILLSADAGCIVFDFSDEEADTETDAGPPDLTATEPSESTNSSDSSPSSNGHSDDPPAMIPVLTGLPASDTGAT